MRNPYIVFYLSCLLFVSVSVAETINIPLGLVKQEPSSYQPFPVYQAKRPKIALALSGGGSRGLAQIGILRVFEKHALPIDGIAGSSIGAIIGGLRAVGYTAKELDSLAYDIDWADLIQDDPPRQQLFLGRKEDRARSILQIRLEGLSPEIPASYTAGQKLSALLNRLVLEAPAYSVGDFSKLHIPFIAVATDLNSGQKQIIRSGSLVKAMQGSMAIPLLFAPVPWDNKFLLDGGLVQNMPVSEAQIFDADLVIALDTTTKLRPAEALNTPWVIVDQLTTIMHRDILEKELQKADMIIQPELPNISNTDFSQIDSLIHAGEQAAEAMMPEILAKLDSLSLEPNNVSCFVKKMVYHGIHSDDIQTVFNESNNFSQDTLQLSDIRWMACELHQTGNYESLSAEYGDETQILTWQAKPYPNIYSVHIHGNTLIKDSTFHAMYEITPGMRFNYHEWERNSKSLLAYYHKRGFSLARIEQVLYQQGQLHLFLNEGKIRRIHLRGNKRTHPFVIMRELFVSENELFNISKIDKGMQNIYSTGYFEGVYFDVTPFNDKYDLTIHLTEHSYTSLRIGYHYDLERQSQGLLEVVEENMLGLGLESSVTGQFGTRDNLLYLNSRADRLMNTFYTAQSSVGIESRKYKYYQNQEYMTDYNKYRQFFKAAIGRQMERLGTLSVEFMTEKFKTIPVHEGLAPKEEVTLTSITLESIVDTRDRMPFPRTGRYHQLLWETGLEFLGSDIPYFKLLSFLESYFPINSKTVLHGKLQWGTADLTTPFVKQYFLGGLESFMGLPDQAFFGKRYFLTGGELRYQIPWFHWLENYISFRYDFGATWGKFAKISSTDFKHGIGLIYSLDSPLGPFHVGYGRVSDGLDQVYFSAGYRF